MNDTSEETMSEVRRQSSPNVSRNNGLGVTSTRSPRWTSTRDMLENLDESYWMMDRREWKKKKRREYTFLVYILRHLLDTRARSCGDRAALASRLFKFRTA